MTISQSQILIVDDELFFRKLYTELLAEEGCAAEVCQNGDDALMLLEEKSFDLVITDMVMPGRSGLDVLREARARPNPPEVILVTGHATLESAIAALKNGARDYLVKPFNPEELKHIVRTALDQRRLLAENDHLRRQLELFRTGQSLSSLIELDRLIPQALAVILREMQAASGCAFSLKNEAVPALVAVHQLPMESAEKLVELLLPELEVADNLCQPSSDLGARLNELEQDYRQMWLLPLTDGGVLQGGLVICAAPHDFATSPRQINLRFLCDQVKLGFDNACRYQDAQQLMYSDDLTGLYNHRYLQVALRQEIRRAQRYGLKFSLLFIDLDRFKQINDCHGHLAGSAALREVGRLLCDCVRDVDTLFRFGGDEFAALLIEADSSSARIVGERIRRKVEQHSFLQEQGLSAQLTVTAGFATYPDDALEGDLLHDLADRDMYVGKARCNVISGADALVGSVTEAESPHNQADHEKK